MAEDDAHVFSDVDASGIAPELAAYLEAVGARPEMQAFDEVGYALLRLAPGQQVLEVGCGLGDDAREIARRTAPGGHVTALDASAAMLAEAQRRHDGGPVDYVLGDVTGLDFPDGTFDRARAERVVQHVKDAERAVAEMARVVRSGGRIALLDTDWQTFVVDVPLPLARRMAAHVLEVFAQPAAGRALRGLLAGAGLVDTEVRAVPFCYTDLATASLLLPQLNEGIPPTEMLVPLDIRDAWFDAIRTADREGRFLAAFTAFVAAGRKP